MSRIGRKPIQVPSGVDVKIDGHHITVKGPKGTLEREIHKDMTASLDNGVITVTRPSDDKEHRPHSDREYGRRRDQRLQ